MPPTYGLPTGALGDIHNLDRFLGALWCDLGQTWQARNPGAERVDFYQDALVAALEAQRTHNPARPARPADHCTPASRSG